MILHQLFDHETYTYSYLLADKESKEAIIIDPVADKVDFYLHLIHELELRLIFALDTHVHADHITALGRLRRKTSCMTYLGKPGDVDCADNGLVDGQRIRFGAIDLKVIYTPGHTDDSYSFYVDDGTVIHLFTGDTLLIRGTGRTDFQNGDANRLYDSIHQKLLAFEDSTIVYPGHDYNGRTTSSIEEERKHNPRLQFQDKADFIEHMNNLKLPNPKYMDVAVPANQSCGNRQSNSGGIS